MIKKIIGCLVLCAIAALCPAPIRDKSSFAHSIPTMTPEQRVQSQKYNGTVGVVGVVPNKTNEDGTGPAPIHNDAKAAANVMASSPDMQAKAVRNLSVAQSQLKLDNQGQTLSPILILILVLGLLGGAMLGAKTYLDKYGPAPKSFRPSEEA
jgi:hypothetical protein